MSSHVDLFLKTIFCFRPPRETRETRPPRPASAPPRIRVTQIRGGGRPTPGRPQNPQDLTAFPAHPAARRDNHP